VTLRRFESYGFADDAPVAARTELARVLRETGWYIPEVLDGATGWNRSDAPVDLVWEHAYDAPGAYARYMCHPFHICVLDRYLLPENPECITASRRELGLGLFGYEVPGTPFRADAGVRRILALRPAPDAVAAEVDAFVAGLGGDRGAPGDPGAATASVAAPNTMGLEWFPDGWTHVWERVFPDETAMTAALAAEADRLAVSPFDRWVDLWYAIEPAPVPTSSPGPGAGPGGTAGGTAGGSADPILVVDTVVVADADADAYLDGFHRWYLPGAQRRGLELVAAWRTPSGIGEGVTVTTALAVDSWAAWEQARNAAVTDPDVHTWIAHRRGLLRGGRRTFATRAPDGGAGPG
jgi:hypothetical protein